ncbi:MULTISPECIES: alpha/beta fold hydrolase [unclassified Clostridium]|uniref:alpha/beta fold hydrolase n=1 Tax=unclassified Clostridium TaxID=2614128 RepID=UPI000297F49B|nr:MULTISPECIES: alpha/beta fold hydrolase [unclassified Clostridium]EKQ57703.1 MAG: lysophospholipase [Clostridium sp. Maddingley MBC34-26]
MDIERHFIQGNGFEIPSIILKPKNSIGSAVIVHGYGGCKEEQLGLALRVAEIGMTTCVIDLRGHGENELPLNENVPLDVETAIKYCRCFGKVVAIGHSLGGRLSLLSGANYVIGVSPALNKTFSNQTKEILKSLRSYRVTEINPNINWDILNKLAEWKYDSNKHVQIIFGSRDVPDIISTCNKLKEKGVPIVQIDKALHNDIFLLNETFDNIVNQLKEWFQ